MFNFFKKNKKQRKEQPQEKKANINKEEVENKIIKLKGKLENSSQDDYETLSQLYEEIGILYKSLDNIDDAIYNFEKSLELYPTIGESYKSLLNFYNQKRRQAAETKNDVEIQLYMNKLDQLRNTAKKITINRK